MAEWEEIKKWLPVIVLLGLGYLIYKRITAPPPEAPAIEFVKIEWLSPGEFYEGEERTVRLTFRNPTRWEWTYDVGVVLGPKSATLRVTIPPGEEESVTATLTMPTPGTYDLEVFVVEVSTRKRVMELTVVDTVRVLEKAVPAIEFIKIEWLSGEVFTPLSEHTAVLTVKNVSAKEWLYAFYIYLDTATMGVSDDITFKPGEQKPVNMRVVLPLYEGGYSVRVGAMAKVDGWERVSETIIGRVQIAGSSLEFVIR